MGDYIIAGVSGASLLLVQRPDDPTSPTRLWNARDGQLGPVKPAMDLSKFGGWSDYEGPQDALDGTLCGPLFDAEAP